MGNNLELPQAQTAATAALAGAAVYMVYRAVMRGVGEEPVPEEGQENRNADFPPHDDQPVLVAPEEAGLDPPDQGLMILEEVIHDAVPLILREDFEDTLNELIAKNENMVLEGDFQLEFIEETPIAEVPTENVALVGGDGIPWDTFDLSKAKQKVKDFIEERRVDDIPEQSAQLTDSIEHFKNKCLEFIIKHSTPDRKPQREQLMKLLKEYRKTDPGVPVIPAGPNPREKSVFTELENAYHAASADIAHDSQLFDFLEEALKKVSGGCVFLHLTSMSKYLKMTRNGNSSHWLTQLKDEIESKLTKALGGSSDEDYLEWFVKDFVKHTSLHSIERLCDLVEKEENDNCGIVMCVFDWELDIKSLKKVSQNELYTLLDKRGEQLKPAVFQHMDWSLHRAEESVWSWISGSDITSTLRRINNQGLNYFEYITLSSVAPNWAEIEKHCPIKQRVHLTAQTIYGLAVRGYNNANYQQLLERFSHQEIIDVMNSSLRYDAKENTLLHSLLCPEKDLYAAPIVLMLFRLLLHSELLLNSLLAQSLETLCLILSCPELQSNQPIKQFLCQSTKRFLSRVGSSNNTVLHLLAKKSTDITTLLLSLDFAEFDFLQLQTNDAGHAAIQTASPQNFRAIVSRYVNGSDFTSLLKIYKDPEEGNELVQGLTLYICSNQAQKPLFQRGEQESRLEENYNQLLNRHGLEEKVNIRKSMKENEGRNILDKTALWLCSLIATEDFNTPKELLHNALISQETFAMFIISFIIQADEDLFQRNSCKLEDIVSHGSSCFSNSIPNIIRSCIVWDSKHMLAALLNAEQSNSMISILSKLEYEHPKTNALHLSITKESKNSFRVLVGFTSKDKTHMQSLLIPLLSEKVNEKTLLHRVAAFPDKEYLTILLSSCELNGFEMIHDLLRQGVKNSTVLQITVGNLKTYSVLLQFYASRPQQLLQLIGATDSNGYSALHTCACSETYIYMYKILEIIPDEYFTQIHELMCKREAIKEATPLQLSMLNDSGSFEVIINFYRKRKIHLSRLLSIGDWNESTCMHIAANSSTTRYLKVLLSLCKPPSIFRELLEMNNKQGLMASEVAFQNGKFLNWDKGFVAQQFNEALGRQLHHQ